MSLEEQKVLPRHKVLLLGGTFLFKHYKNGIVSIVFLRLKAKLLSPIAITPVV